MCAARGVDRECCVMVAKTGCVIDGKICMSRKKIMKTVTTAKKKRAFYHDNIAYLNKLTDKIFGLLVQVMTSLMHFGRKEGDDVSCHVSKLIIHLRDYSTALFTRAVSFCSNTVRCSYFICAKICIPLSSKLSAIESIALKYCTKL